MVRFTKKYKIIALVDIKLALDILFFNAFVDPPRIVHKSSRSVAFFGYSDRADAMWDTLVP